MFKKIRKKEFWETEHALIWVWWRTLGLALLLSIAAAYGVTWVIISTDSTRYLLSAMMGVSGSILGFLVIYLSFAFEGIRRFFGRYSNSIFRRDRFIWTICWFFSCIILVSLAAMTRVDHQDWLLRLLLNFSCFSFSIAIATIVWAGKMILKKTDSAEEIRKQIDLIKLTDFRQEPGTSWEWGASYWLLTEDRENPVDRITGILLHNIVEKNNSVVASMLRSLYDRVGVLLEDLESREWATRAVSRYNDILLLSFDQAKSHNDPLVFKLIFSNYRNLADLIATRKMDRTVIDKVMDGARSTVRYWIEAENEQLVSDAFLTYNQMCQSQIERNLPAELETWRTNETGRMVVIDSNRARANEDKFIAILLAGTLHFSELVEQALDAKNPAIPEVSARMLGSLLEHLILMKMDSRFQQVKFAEKAAFFAFTVTQQYAEKRKTTRFGFLKLLVNETAMQKLLQEDSEFSKAVFDHWVAFALFLVENNYFGSMDVDLIGNIGRRITHQLEKIPSALNTMTALVDINRKARKKLMVSLVASKTPVNRTEVTNLIKELDKDLASWLKAQNEAAHPDINILTLLKSNQWLIGET